MTQLPKPQLRVFVSPSAEELWAVGKAGEVIFPEGARGYFPDREQRADQVPGPEQRPGVGP